MALGWLWMLWMLMVGEAGAEPLLMDREMEAEARRFEELHAAFGERAPQMPHVEDVLVRWPQLGLPHAQDGDREWSVRFDGWAATLSATASEEGRAADEALLLVTRRSERAAMQITLTPWPDGSRSVHLGDPQRIQGGHLLPVLAARCGDVRCMTVEHEGTLVWLPKEGAVEVLATLRIRDSVERRRGGMHVTWPMGGMEESTALWVRPADSGPPRLRMERWSGVWGDAIADEWSAPSTLLWSDGSIDCAKAAERDVVDALWRVEQCEPEGEGIVCERGIDVGVRGIESRRVKAEEVTGYAGIQWMGRRGVCGWTQ